MHRALISLFLLLFLTFPVEAQEPSTAFKSTPYPIPRFVSLKSDEVYARTGPGKKYPVKWLFQRKGLPVEVILEYEVWRKVRDYKGDEGWVHQSLISGRRSGFLELPENHKGEAFVALRRKASGDVPVTAKAEPGTLVFIQECDTTWCKLSHGGYEGWVGKPYIWGVYDDEVFD